MDEYPEHLAFVQIHYTDAYSTSWGDQRAAYYGPAGLPTSWMDGVLKREGAWPFSTYRNDLILRLEVPTEVRLAMGGTHVSDNVYEVKLWVCLKEDAPATTSMNVHMVQVLDHWPFLGEHHRNGVKQGAPALMITLDPGECALIEHEFALDSTSMVAKLRYWLSQPVKLKL